MSNDPSVATAPERPWLRPALFALFGLLVAASLLNGFHLPLLGRRVRPEHVVAPAVFLALILAQRSRRAAAIRVDAFTVLAIAWVAVNALSSSLFAPRPAESFVHVLRFVFLIAAFLTVANLPMARGANDWARAFRLWLALGLLTFLYGIVGWVLARHFSLWLPGTPQGYDQVEISIRGTQFERNLFGIAAATVLSVSAYGWLAQLRLGRVALASKRFLVGACFVAGIAVVCSLTRSAWVALVLVAPATWLLLERRGLARGDRPLLQLAAVLPLFLGTLIVLFGILPDSRNADTVGAGGQGTAVAAGKKAARPVKPGAGQPAEPPVPADVVESRLATFKSLDSDYTLKNRLEDAKWALDDWLSSPVLGNGTGSFVQIHGKRLGTEAWISNLVLHTLVDTGLAGLVIQASLFWLVAWRAWRAAALHSDPIFQIGLRAMTVGLGVMVIAYQLTDGTWMALFWIHLGLVVNGVYAARDSSRAAVTR